METQYKFADFDSLHIEYDRFILTRHGKEYVYETPRNEAGRIIAVKGRGIDIRLDGAGAVLGHTPAAGAEHTPVAGEQAESCCLSDSQHLKPTKFDDVQVTYDEIVLVKDGVEHRFTTPRNEAGRVTAIVCGERSRPITYGASRAAKNFAGVEYEQVNSTELNLTPPSINSITIDILDSASGTYGLTISGTNCTLDSRAKPFFFFYSQEGVFERFEVGADGAASVMFYAEAADGGNNAQFMVGVGDHLGQVARKVFHVKGDLI